MDVVPTQRMTADEFIAWAFEQPKGENYELQDGEIVAMSPENYRHSRVKYRVFRRLEEAADAIGLVCDIVGDGFCVVIGPGTVFISDASLRVGDPLKPDATRMSDPLIVVEVTSPSSRTRDFGPKLSGYFQLPSLRHYLIVDPEDGAMIRHRRDEDGSITTSTVSGPLYLDPPGLTLDGIFPPERG